MFQWHQTLREFRLSFPLQDEWKQMVTTEGSTFPFFVRQTSADYVRHTSAVSHVCTPHMYALYENVVHV